MGLTFNNVPQTSWHTRPTYEVSQDDEHSNPRDPGGQSAPQQAVQQGLHTRERQNVPKIHVSQPESSSSTLAGQPVGHAALYPDLGNIHDTRLVSIHSATNDNDPIVCSSEAVALHDETVYDALSYCWGNQDSSVGITLNGCHHPIRQSLFEALTALRHRGIERVWIDSLSIHQEDIAEKDRQISKMHIIYSYAARVFAWIGPKYQPLPGKPFNRMANGEFGVEFLSKSLPNRAFNEKEIVAVQDVAARAYWTRSWIIQELCRSRKAFILCGSSTADFAKFWSNLEKFNTKSEFSYLVEDVRQHFDSLRAFHTQESAKSRQPQMPLVKALLLSRHSKASHDRDKVFAILNLAHDSSKLVATPNYWQSTNTIFWKLAHCMVHLQGHVSIILLARRESPHSDTHRRASTSSRDFVNSRTSLLTLRPGQATHQKHSSLSSQDVRGFNEGDNKNSLPSWVPCWSSLDTPLPDWVKQSVEHDRQRKASATSHEASTLCIRGVFLETIESTSGIPGTPKFSAPQPNEPQDADEDLEQDTGLEMASTRDSRRSSIAEKPFSTPDGVVHKLWHALLAPLCAKEEVDIPSIRHQCAKFGCIANDEDGFAVASVLMGGGQQGGREVIRQWMGFNKSLRIKNQCLGEWLTTLLSQADLHDAGLDRFTSETHKRSAPLMCELTAEADWLSRALEYLEKYKMRLAVTSRRTFKVVYCEARPGDMICRLDGCSLPVVLRKVDELFLEPAPEDVSSVAASPDTFETQAPQSVGNTSPPMKLQQRISSLQSEQRADAPPSRDWSSSSLPNQQPLNEACQFQYVGEVYIHDHLNNGFVNQSITGWKHSHFQEGHWRDFRIV